MILSNNTMSSGEYLAEIHEDNLKTENKSTHIIIGKDTFFQLGANTFESFDFKLNKRGGEGGKIKFVKMFGEYKIGDKVVLYVNGLRVFTGFIESIGDLGLTINMIPVWGLLDYVYITDTLSFESNYSIYDLVISFADKIRSVGISFNSSNITMSRDITITTTLAGRNIKDILDDMEKALPKNYVYGVDGFGEFYFKSFSENKEQDISWHKAHFSDNELESDYSNLYSEYIVKVKDKTMNAYNVLKDIVGDSTNYPPTVLTEMVGKKTGVFEYNFSASDKDALDYAYQSLKLQSPLETLKLKNINYKVVNINANECLSVVLKPSENYYEDFEVNFSTAKSISSNLTNGTIQTIGTIIGYARKITQSVDERKILDFNSQSEYVNICNRSFDINRIILYYISEDSTNKFLITDGKKEDIIFGSGGILRINLNGFSKRELKLNLIDTNSEIVFSKMRCYFNQGSKKVMMNVREITYSCKKGIITVNAKLSKLNAQLTGYMFERDRKIKNLEKLLTN